MGSALRLQQTTLTGPEAVARGENVEGGLLKKDVENCCKDVEESAGKPRWQELNTPSLVEQQPEQDTVAACEHVEELSIEQGERPLLVADAGESRAWE